MIKKYIFLIVSVFCYLNALSQEKLPVANYANSREYTIAAIDVKGIKFLDKKILVNMSDLMVGDEIAIPGDKITKAVEKFWDQGLFADVKIIADSIVGINAYLTIYLEERPRLNSYQIIGAKKSDQEDLKEMLKLRRRSQVTDDVLNRIRYQIHNFYIDKGFYNVDINIKQMIDTTYNNTVNLKIEVERNKKVRIKDIVIKGNEEFKDGKLRRKMKNTKKVNINFFKSSKFIKSDYKEDKQSLIDFYNEKGFRDAIIESDSVYYHPEKENKLMILINLQEGNKYYFRNIRWVGNTKYSSKILNVMLGIKKGAPYDKSLLDQRLFADEDAVNSLYLDNGYLFSSITPIEKKVENDSIDLEMRVYEGKQATIDKVIIRGNTKTNEHVVRREIRTLPGELFSRSDIIRSVRELAQLGHFDPEKIAPNPIPNQANGTVDIEYALEEKANDQLEVSGGYGAGMLVGTIGLRFSNFAVSRIFEKGAWKPVPSGNSQTLSLRAQSNGRWYQSYNFTFMEPWLGGKKPNSLTVSIFHTKYNNGSFYSSSNDGFMKITGGSVGLGRRLKWPDDFFTLYNELSFQRYHLNNYSRFAILGENAISNNLSLKGILGRNSVDQPIFPRRGSGFSLSLELTPPYSLFSSTNYSSLPTNKKYRWLEYHKWKFKSEWYTTIIQNLVLCTKTQFGLIGFYNNDIGYSPFETFDLGGDGMYGYNLYGRETIALRGYDDGALTPQIITDDQVPVKMGNIFDKFTVELRYPFTLNPQATIYGLVFVEGGNAWYSFDEFNPLSVKRAAGVGIRAFLPMFGMLGLDWGYGFDDVTRRYDGVVKQGINGSQIHFILGQQF